MEKKEYIKPEIAVLQMETLAILAGSLINKAKEEDYRNSDEYMDEDGFIYAD